MRPSPSAQSVLATANTVITAGPRPGLSRRAMALVGGAVLMSAMALAPESAQAQNYRGLLDSPSISASQYGRDEVLRATEGRLAEVVMVRPVEIRNTRTLGIGAVVGGVVGTAAANNIGNRDARTAARVLLGGLGALAGQRVQNRVSEVDGVQITVMERDARGRAKLLNVVQAAGMAIGPGDVVMLEGRGSKVRVVPLDPQLQAHLRAASAPAPRRAFRP